MDRFVKGCGDRKYTVEKLKKKSYFARRFDTEGEFHSKRFDRLKDAKEWGDEWLDAELQQRSLPSFSIDEISFLNHSLSDFILPRLKRFKETSHRCPDGIAWEEWHKNLQVMIESFEEIEKYYDLEENVNMKKIEKGLKSFKKWFLELWF